MSEEKIRKPIPTPSAKTKDELGILVLDGSGSMGDPDREGKGTKAEAVSEAVKGLIERLKTSSRSPDFSLSLIIFDDQVESPRLSPTPIKDIDVNALNTNPYLGGQTAIGDALEKAGEIADEFLNRGGLLSPSVVIMLMSDGQSNAGKDPLAVSEALKNKFGEKATICCAAYGKDADQDTLKKICSDSDKDFMSTANMQDTKSEIEALRSFFIKSLMGMG